MTIHTKEAWDAIQSLRAIAQEFENGNAHRDEVDAAMLEVEKFYPGYQDAYVAWPSQIESSRAGQPVDSNALDAAVFLASPEGEKELQNIKAGISALTPGVKTGLIPGSPEAEAIIAAGETAWYVKPGQEIHTVDPEARKRELAIEAEMDSPEFLAELNKEDEDDWTRSTAVGDSKLPTELLAEFCFNTPAANVKETAEQFAARLDAFERGYFSEPRAARFVPGTPEFIAAEAQWLAEAQSESPETKAAMAALNGETPEEYQARLDDANKLFISTRLHSAISSITEARGRMSPEMYASPEIKEICNRLEVFTLDFDANTAKQPN